MYHGTVLWGVLDKILLQGVLWVEDERKVETEPGRSLKNGGKSCWALLAESKASYCI
jgi:hypothetical protein